MNILGIDSSGMVASVAIVSDDVVIAEYTMNHKKTHSETLLPMIDEIVKTSEMKLEDLDAIARSWLLYRSSNRRSYSKGAGSRYR